MNLQANQPVPATVLRKAGDDPSTISAREEFEPDRATGVSGGLRVLAALVQLLPWFWD